MPSFFNPHASIHTWNGPHSLKKHLFTSLFSHNRSALADIIYSTQFKLSLKKVITSHSKFPSAYILKYVLIHLLADFLFCSIHSVSISKA